MAKEISHWNGSRGYRLAGDIARQVHDLLIPPMCQGCGIARTIGIVDGDPLAAHLCTCCRREIGAVDSGCAHCWWGRPTKGVERGCTICRSLVLTRPDWDVPIRFVGPHRGALRDLVLAAKWGRDHAALGALVDVARPALLQRGWHLDLDGVVAVPRDRWRTLRRGAPLSIRLARELAASFGWPVLPSPKRRRRPPQSRLTGAARRRNLRRCFEYRDRAVRRLAQKRVLIIDDVMTTGTTIHECAASLRACAVDDVRALVITLAPDPGR